ncbi:uncharacterized protein LOC111384209 [Olea europaea var. sylvestris]|uniref:uncharacterized protein LOC111384209 n=1 Tax=Olea europaea var. sylvestris TaxID=158386 RepID=UPI000C1CFB59|nr:uncharacterized protein LOC111384209 [Olea europaea var. sylvestris]
MQSGEKNFSCHCRNKGRKILLIEKVVDEIEGDEIESDADGKEAVGVDMVEIFLNTVVGLTAPKMLKGKGEIEQSGVVVMLEGVAILKFIPTDEVQHIEALWMGTRAKEWFSYIVFRILQLNHTSTLQTRCISGRWVLIEAESSIF